jgi:ABC-2 type transport system permease protein
MNPHDSPTPVVDALLAWELFDARHEYAIDAPTWRRQRPLSPPSPFAVARRLLRYELRHHRRTPELLAFELALPLALLGILGTLLAGESFGPLDATYNERFVPHMVALGIATTCLAGTGIVAAYRRLNGDFKRLRGTPAPNASVLAALAAEALITAVLVATALAVCGRWWFGIDLPRPLPYTLTVAIGAASLTAVGIAVSTFVTRAEAAPALTNLVLWPMAFIAGAFVYVPPDSWIDRVGSLTPLRHLQESTVAASTGAGTRWGSLAVIALWGIAGVVVTALRLRPGRSSGD